MFSMAILKWCHKINVELYYIAFGKPMQKGFVESFHGSFREECFNETLSRLSPKLGSGLIDHSQNITVAAMQMADMKVCAHLS